MKDDEIKEILDKLKKMINENKDNIEYHSRDGIQNWRPLYDQLEQEINLYEKIINCITNLQQENERLKLEKDTKSVSEIICENLHDVYKSRCEKAVEIINKYELIVGYYDYADEDGYWDTDSNNNLQEELKDTLNGRRDE